MKENHHRYYSLVIISILSLSSLVILTQQTTTNIESITGHEFIMSNLQTPIRDYWPTDGWRNSTLEAENMSATILNNMLDVIEQHDYPIDSVFIVRNGYSVFEEYPSGLYNPTRRHLMHSVSKSFTSTLIGIALQQGFIESVDEYLLDFFPEYTPANPDSRKDDITIEHLLMMRAGLEWDESSLPYTDPDVNDIGGMMASTDVVQYVLDKPMTHNPGEEFLYSGGVATLLGAIVQQVSESTTNNFAEEFLFEPLGFGLTGLYTYPGGWYNTQGGLRLNTHDMAKLGYLYLNNGTWNGTQIISSDYVTNATYPHSTDLYFPPEYAGYGWQWWLAPDLETFMALGRAGQKIIVSRELDLVVVFTARVGDTEYDPEFDLYNNYILESIAAGPDSNQTAIPTEFLIATIIVSGLAILGVVVIFYRKRSQS
ncbi:MAG: serine hydrolase domain-containing protein [Candidatus Thorarchaeota archaeon]|jgi:CubicO group peptidase (beta-lactamase class C family)